MQDTIAAGANATSSNPYMPEKLSEKEQKWLDIRTSEVTNLFLAQAKAKGKVSKLERQISKMKVDESSTSEKKQQIELVEAQEEVSKIEDEILSAGLVKVSKDPEVSILSSTTSDFDDNGEFMVYYDSSVGKYLAHYGGNWLNDNYFDDAQENCSWLTGCSTGWHSIGGPDGIGIFSLHKDINIYNRKFYTLDEDFVDTDRTDNNLTEPIDARGAGFTWQEKAYNTRYPTISSWSAYDSYRLLEWFYFSFVGGTPAKGSGTISFKAEVGHTWSNTSVNSISVGPWSVGIGFNTNDSKFLESDITSITF